MSCLPTHYNRRQFSQITYIYYVSLITSYSSFLITWVKCLSHKKNWTPGGHHRADQILGIKTSQCFQGRTSSRESLGLHTLSPILSPRLSSIPMHLLYDLALTVHVSVCNQAPTDVIVILAHIKPSASHMINASLLLNNM